MNTRLVTAGLLAIVLAGPVPAQENAGESATLSRQEVSQLYRTAEEYRRSDDFDNAVPIYERLIGLGHAKSYVRLGQAYRDMGDGAAALNAFREAAERNSTLARLEMGKGHLRGDFGEVSDPQQGMAILETLAEEEGMLGARYEIAEAYRTGEGVAQDAKLAFEMFMALSEQGYVRATHRMGDMYRAGAGTDRDLEAAAAAYRSAADGGYDYSLIKLSDTLLDARRPAEALAALEEARDRGASNAELLLAEGHCVGKFGRQSNRSAGCSQVAALAESGNVRAGAIALKLHERRSRRITSLDLPKVLAEMEAAMAAGDRRATEGLARAYRKLSWLIPDARVKHAALVEQYAEQMRPRRRVPEQLHALYNPRRPAASYSKLVEHLEDADEGGFYFGLMELRAIDKNAFVYAIQRELREAGYYNGRLSGIMTRPTVRAMVRYCAAKGGNHLCRHGPLNYNAAAFIANELHETRSPPG